MAFVAAMSTPAQTKVGVNGSDVYTEEGVGDPRVALFAQLVRGVSHDYIEQKVRKILQLGPEGVKDLAVLSFQTRDIRGGKGERDIFYIMMRIIAQYNLPLAEALIALIPEYGCWKDCWVLSETCYALQPSIDALVKEQFQMDQESKTPSLLVKWLPRESGAHSELAKHFANLLFPLTPKEDNQHLRVYRKTVANLNRILGTTEVKMCGNTWSQIEPSHVPGRLFKQCKSAFFNEKKVRGQVEPRYPDRLDRVACAEAFANLMTDVRSGKTVMKGGTTTSPHEHIHELLHNPLSPYEHEVMQAQWDAIRAEVLKEGGLGNIVPLCDFSGSMDGVPKEVSLALGILISEVASPAFKDHIITFDSTPKWYSFAGKTTLYEKVKSIGGLGQGLSTNLQGACDLILQRLVEHKVAPEDAPKDLLILTDMGFDQASNGYTYNTKSKVWETQFEMIRLSFAKHGYQPPRIICWNLRAEFKDFHAKAHEIGVVQLSGWSPSVLKALQSPDGVQVESSFQAMRKLLDAPRYDAVRQVVEGLNTTL